MANPIVWFEIITRDLDESKKFYDAVFDWEISKDENFPTMEMVNTGAEPGGSLFKGPEEMPLGVTVYFQVDDIDETMKKVEEAGGEVFMPKMEIPNVGFVAVFKDPQGVFVSIFKPNEMSGEM